MAEEGPVAAEPRRMRQPRHLLAPRARRGRATERSDSPPGGDAFLTRHVKPAGTYWTLRTPRGRNRDHRRKIGLVAPVGTIEAACAEASETEARWAEQRAAGARNREHAEAAYPKLAAAVVRWLDFASEHHALAVAIGRGAAEQLIAFARASVQTS
jgi:hypothetical protein